MDKHKFELTLRENKIEDILNCGTNEIDRTFQSPLTNGDYKIYIITNKQNNIFYIGATKRSIGEKMRDGLTQKYSYKWKKEKSVVLNVWIFENYSQEKIENVEAELAFLVRTKTGKWPIHQNEIHFNNKFDKGKDIAKKIYDQLMKK